MITRAHTLSLSLSLRLFLSIKIRRMMVWSQHIPNRIYTHMCPINYILTKWPKREKWTNGKRSTNLNLLSTEYTHLSMPINLQQIHLKFTTLFFSLRSLLLLLLLLSILLFHRVRLLCCFVEISHWKWNVHFRKWNANQTENCANLWKVLTHTHTTEKMCINI